jgi:glucose-6-phosphate 1-epimerase
MIQTPETLDAEFSVAGAIRFEVGEGGLPRVVLTSDGSVAHVYLHGAHVTHFQPAGREPVVFLSRESLFTEGKAIRGGIPLIFPWFGPNAEDASLPAHGFARNRTWRFASAAVLEDGRVQVEFAMKDDKATRALWDFSFGLTFRVMIGKTLEMEFVVQNTGDKPFRFEEALHTYLAVSDVRQVGVTGLLGAEYLDKTDAMQRKRQEEDPIRFTGETDRLYLDTVTQCVADDVGGGRRIVVGKSGSNSTVVWNPWIEKAAGLKDFGDDEWLSMVCIETCNADANAVTLAPGVSHTLRAIVGVE